MAHPLDIGTRKGGACPPPPPKRAPVARPAPERPFTPPPPPPPAMPGPCCPSTNTVVMHDMVIKSDDGTIEVHPGYDHGKPAFFLKVNAELVRPNIYGEYPIEVHEGTVGGEPADLIVIREMAGATADADGNYGIPPKPVAGDQDKFLRGDGTWSEPSMEDLPVFTGATAEQAGAKGLVPAPATGDRGKYLKGDGTWGDAEIDIRQGDHITVTKEGNTYTIGAERFPVEIDQNSLDILGGDGTPEHPLSIATLVGATAGQAGTAGVAPAPAMGDQNKFLKGDGTWAAVPESYTPIACDTQTMETWLDAVDAEDNTPEVNGNG